MNCNCNTTYERNVIAMLLRMTMALRKRESRWIIVAIICITCGRAMVLNSVALAHGIAIAVIAERNYRSIVPALLCCLHLHWYLYVYASCHYVVIVTHCKNRTFVCYRLRCFNAVPGSSPHTAAYHYHVDGAMESIEGRRVSYGPFTPTWDLTFKKCKFAHFGARKWFCNFGVRGAASIFVTPWPCCLKDLCKFLELFLDESVLSRSSVVPLGRS